MSRGVSSLSSHLVCSLKGLGKKMSKGFVFFSLFWTFPHIYNEKTPDARGVSRFKCDLSLKADTLPPSSSISVPSSVSLRAAPVFLAQTKRTFVAYLPASYHQTVKRHLLPTKPFAYLCTHNWFCVISPGKCQRDNWATAAAWIKPSVKVW